MSTGTRHLRITVHGHVQGVWFRASTRDAADEHGVTGWVRNDPAGTVTAELHGPADAVEAVLAFCRTGPPHARVDRVEVAELSDEAMTAGVPTGFEVRR